MMGGMKTTMWPRPWFTRRMELYVSVLVIAACVLGVALFFLALAVSLAVSNIQQSTKRTALTLEKILARLESNRDDGA